MSEMDDEELDYTRIGKGLVGLKNLKEMRIKYKDAPYMLKKINEKIEELENEYDR